MAIKQPEMTNVTVPSLGLLRPSTGLWFREEDAGAHFLVQLCHSHSSLLLERPQRTGWGGDWSLRRSLSHGPSLKRVPAPNPPRKPQAAHHHVPG